MSYTFQDIRNECLKLLGEYDAVTANVDTFMSNRIDTFINHYYMDLTSRDKVSSYTKITQFPIENMLGETFDYDTYTTTAVTFSQASAYAYYFEVDGDCAIDVLDGSSTTTMTTLSTITLTGNTCFTAYKAFATAGVSSDYIKLSFYGSTVFNIRNVAFYPYAFGNATASIPAFTPYVEYSIASNYADIKNVTYRYKSDYGTFTDYLIEHGKLLIPRGYSAEFFFNYWKQVSALTTATNTFEIKDKTVLIIPYGVAGDILLGDGLNISAGQALKAEYEKKKAQIDPSNEYGRQKVDNILGW